MAAPRQIFADPGSTNTLVLAATVLEAGLNTDLVRATVSTAGGIGDDSLLGRGGIGALFVYGCSDSLLAVLGGDSVFGCDGSDVIRAGADVQLIDGGFGFDMLAIGGVRFASGTAGVVADLTGGFNLLERLDVYALVTANFSGVDRLCCTNRRGFPV